ncbi:hypothetical protein DM02DRAFT_193983 [Periconia macrospinosa]|uniref:Uncharacterized protein n=1 Tax=Periconia macrospinosa TaxID=97972 RepID=A0A2V1D8B3_9PLEO|nr:hypothetical protein DM02DRAFT_193983 [Periconia macrospinosa]
MCPVFARLSGQKQYSRTRRQSSSLVMIYIYAWHAMAPTDTTPGHPLTQAKPESRPCGWAYRMRLRCLPPSLTLPSSPPQPRVTLSSLSITSRTSYYSSAQRTGPFLRPLCSSFTVSNPRSYPSDHRPVNHALPPRTHTTSVQPVGTLPRVSSSS